jgi:predicted MFS family arabinose efflux permease
MNSAHSMGGIIGIFAWIILAQMVGWRLSLIFSGGLGLVTAFLMIMTIPRSDLTAEHDGRMDNNKAYRPTRQGEKLKISDAVRVLSNRALAYLGLVLIGIQTAWAIELTFIVIYLQTLGFSAELAGIIAILPLVFAIVSAPLIGAFYDKVRDTRKVLFICGVGMTMAIAGLSLGNLYVSLLQLSSQDFSQAVHSL